MSKARSVSLCDGHYDFDFGVGKSANLLYRKEAEELKVCIIFCDEDHYINHREWKFPLSECMYFEVNINMILYYGKGLFRVILFDTHYTMQLDPVSIEPEEGTKQFPL